MNVSSGSWGRGRVYIAYHLNHKTTAENAPNAYSVLVKCVCLGAARFDDNVHGEGESGNAHGRLRGRTHQNRDLQQTHDKNLTEPKLDRIVKGKAEG